MKGKERKKEILCYWTKLLHETVVMFSKKLFTWEKMINLKATVCFYSATYIGRIANGL